MAWLLISKRNRRRAVSWTFAGVGTFAASLILGSLAVLPGPVAWTVAGFISFVVCMHRALRLWRADEMLFEPLRQWQDPAHPWDREQPSSRLERSRRVGQLRHV
jgi:hypothetical protein